MISTSPDTTVCGVNSVPLFASGGNVYVWSPANTLDNSSSPTPVATPLYSTTYYVAVKGSKGCIQKDSVQITVNPLPLIAQSNDTSICKNTEAHLFVNGGATYQWDPSASLNDSHIANPIATPGSSTTYHVKVVSEKGCSVRTSIKVGVKPVPDIIISPDSLICNKAKVQLSIEGGNFYVWSPAATLDDPASHSPVASPKTPTTYTVTGEDQNGCTNSESISVKVNFDDNYFYGVPNSFTPNGDGLNDCFGVRSWGKMDQLEFSIYNRLGERVFYSNNPANCWDGRYKGMPQDTDIFVYIIHAKTICGKIDRKGTVQLLR